MVLEDLDEPRHVRALLFGGQGHGHFNGGNRGLRPVGCLHHHRVLKILDAHLLNGEPTRVPGGLHIGQVAGLEFFGCVHGVAFRVASVEGVGAFAIRPSISDLSRWLFGATWLA